MSETIGITVSSQLKSANTEKDIELHSGKKNRGKFKHANEDIDRTRSHLNVEFDLLSRDELLEKHYGEKIAKHNKNNNSESRRWDMEKFLATFEGKKVKVKGKETNNERWATASQISYFGGKDTLNPVLDALREAGASEQEIINVYASGYREYIERHNERFPTLPIYHSDIHFDETTPHGHDAIVVMGHTEKGNPSDSINNALGELYGYPKNFEDRRANMERYRAENDMLMFDSIAPKLESLASDYGLDIKFEPIRTGHEDSLSVEEYKHKKELEKQENDFREYTFNISMLLEEKENKLHERERELNDKQADLEQIEASQIAIDKALREKEEELKKKEEELKKREKEIQQQEKTIAAEKSILKKHNAVATAVSLAVLKGDSKFPNIYKKIEKEGVSWVDPYKLQAVLTDSISRADAGKRAQHLGDETFINRQIAIQEAKYDGPEL